MAEEFQESEVIFQDSPVQDEDTKSDYSPLNLIESRNSKNKRKKISGPVSIPATNFRYVESDIDGGDGEMVPPHVIIGRRVAAKIMALSLCTGKGRTLKGRDLSEFRNSILRMTGFLET